MALLAARTRASRPFQRLASSVSQVKDFNQRFLLPNTIVDDDWTVDKLPHPGTLLDRNPHIREASEEIEMIQKIGSEARGGAGVIVGDIAGDASEILQCFLCVLESEIHLGSSFRMCSLETVFPDSASLRPSSIAARVSSSSIAGAVSASSKLWAFCMARY